MKTTSKETGEYHHPITAEFEHGQNDPLGFFEAVCLEGLEGKWMIIPAALQRRFFGDVPFGRQRVKVGDAGLVTICRTTSFGGDWEASKVIWNQSEECWTYQDGSKAVKTSGRLN